MRFLYSSCPNCEVSAVQCGKRDMPFTLGNEMTPDITSCIMSNETD